MTAGPVGIKSCCPICGESMTALTETTKPENVGVNQLRTHIRSTTGDGHGPHGTVPDDISLEALAKYVEVSEVVAAPA